MASYDCRWFWLVVIFAASQMASAASLDTIKANSANADSLGRIKALTGQLMAQAQRQITELDTDDFVLIVDAYGNLVSQTRELGGGKGDFEYLIDRGQALRQRCRDKVRSLESVTHEDEVKLEQLYRSDVWHDINYALSAVGYWQAWALLGIAHSKDGERDQVAWLNRAESGFQASSVRILYPGIVYGSWLGMGYVAAARDQPDVAEERFRRLTQALVSDPENPVRKIAEAELTVLALRRGEVQPVTTRTREPLSPSLANVYLEEAFVLLQQHRETGTGAIAAAERLKALIEEGYLTTGLVARILFYRDEIVGQDLGLFSHYVDIEFAYAYQQYDTVVLKYREFEQRGGLDLLINLRTLQYHYAVALLKIGQYHDAWNMAEKLRGKSDLPAPVIKALPKLSFLIAQALHQQKGSNRNRVRVLNAAEYFLTKSPDDPDISAAHLALGQLSFNPDRAERHLREAKRDAKLKGSIAMAQLQRSISTFNSAIEQGAMESQRKQAREILAQLEELPRYERDKPWSRILSLQMQTVLAQNLEQVVSGIDGINRQAAQDPNFKLDANSRQILLWSKLRALDQLDAGRVLGFVQELVSLGEAGDALVQREIYRFFLGKEQRREFGDLIRLVDAVYPAWAGQTQDQRQLRLMQIRARTALGQPGQAFELAQAMVGEFPNSGDAWMAYAESAEAVEDFFTAERAWAKIASAQPEGAPRWREAMAQRVELMGYFEDRVEDICAVLEEAQRYRHLASAVEQEVMDTRLKASACP
ncbi:MAG TPA: hypothetical protein DIT58_02575 [Porticoccaceae bacterium]|nr:hypothetical protein [Porticoccaceae bacterium]